MTDQPSSGDSSNWSILSTFDSDVVSRNFSKLKSEIVEGVGFGYPVWDVLSKILHYVGISENQNDIEMMTFFSDAVNNFFQVLSSREWILIFMAELKDSLNIFALKFSLPFIQKCILTIGFDDCKEVSSVLSIIQSTIDEFIEYIDTDIDLSTQTIKLHDLLKGVGEFLLSIFSHGKNIHLKENYFPHIIYYFSKPLNLLDVSALTIPVFSSYLATLQSCGDGIYTNYQIFSRRVYMSVESIDMISSADEDLASAYILIRRVCRACNCYWPLVLDENFEFSMLVTISAVKCVSFEKRIRCGIPPFLSDRRSFLSTLELLIELFSTKSSALSTTWWRKFPTYLLISLESFSKLPLSSVDIPPETKLSIKCIENLLSAATITARCYLFAGILQRSTSEYHCGFRAHFITLFKNFLHETLLLRLDANSTDCSDRENELEKEVICTPYTKRYFQSISEIIFLYPLPGCADSMLDQFTWLMAALNMILYLKVRCDSNSLAPFIVRDLLQAISRPDCNCTNRLKSKFMDPIIADLHELSKKYERAEKEHLFVKNPVLAPGAPSLEDCKVTLLRLRLLNDLLNRLKDFPVL